MKYAKMFKGRIRLLLLASSLAVALVFGLSFYFSLVSAESALSSAVPELAELAERFKSTLTLNTLAFVGIIIGSFVALGSLVTDRLFKPLDGVEKGLLSLASGKLPPAPGDSGGGPFDALWSSFVAARSRIENHERAEISTLEKCVEGLADGRDVTDTLRELIASKQALTGSKEVERAKEQDDSSNDPLFMQPV